MRWPSFVTKMPVPELDVWGSACSGRDGTGCGVGLGPGAAAPSETPILTVNGRVNGAPLSDDQSDPEISVAMRSIWASSAAWSQVSVKPTPPRPV